MREELLSRIKAGSSWAQCEPLAGSLAKAMLEGGAEESLVVKELRILGISRRGAKQLVRAAKPSPTEEPSPPVKIAKVDLGNPVCPHCLAPVGQFDHFCPKCSGPITAIASMDPMGQVYAYGDMVHKAVSSKPKFIVVLGMWLIFGPQIPFLLFGLFLTVSNIVAPGHVFHTGNGSSIISSSDSLLAEILHLLIVIAVLALYSAILWKVTARYRKPRESGRKT
jgi:hypothetical protein